MSKRPLPPGRHNFVVPVGSKITLNGMAYLVKGTDSTLVIDVPPKAGKLDKQSSRVQTFPESHRSIGRTRRQDVQPGGDSS